jgi:hypothetical protein
MKVQGHWRQPQPKSEGRNLKIFSWASYVPISAVCTRCNRVFRVPPAAMTQVPLAEQSLNKQFASHECKGSTRKTCAPGSAPM